MTWMLIVLGLYVSWTDLRQRRIPNRALLAGLLLAGWIGIGSWPTERWAAHIGMGTVIVCLFGLVSWLRPDLLGMGDVKLLGLFAFSLGLRPFVLILTAACLMILLAAVLLLMGRRIGRNSALPFAPFLTLGLMAYHFFIVITCPWTT